MIRTILTFLFCKTRVVRSIVLIKIDLIVRVRQVKIFSSVENNKKRKYCLRKIFYECSFNI